jgi:hypothetical protein
MARFDPGAYARELGAGMVRLVLGGIGAVISVVIVGIGIYFAGDYMAQQRIAQEKADNSAALARRGYSSAGSVETPSTAQGWGEDAVVAAQSQPSE